MKSGRNQSATKGELKGSFGGVEGPRLEKSATRRVPLITDKNGREKEKRVSPGRNPDVHTPFDCDDQVIDANQRCLSAFKCIRSFASDPTVRHIHFIIVNLTTGRKGLCYAQGSITQRFLASIGRVTTQNASSSHGIPNCRNGWRAVTYHNAKEW